MTTADFGFDSTAEEVTQGVDLSGTSWLITGFNSGLGEETARVLASVASVRAAVDAVRDTGIALDGIIANAGSRRTANALHPGVIKTNLSRHIPDAEGMFSRMTVTLKTVEQGAATQCFVATHPSLSGASGQYFSDCQEARAIPAAYDDALAERLWARTEEILSTL